MLLFDYLLLYQYFLFLDTSFHTQFSGIFLFTYTFSFDIPSYFDEVTFIASLRQQPMFDIIAAGYGHRPALMSSSSAYR